MTELLKGSFCKSTAGHDKDVIYIIVDTENGIKVSDGRFKKLENAKKKNPKHLQLVDYEDRILAEKLAAGKLHNEDIKYSIKKYLKSLSIKQEVMNV